MTREELEAYNAAKTAFIETTKIRTDRELTGYLAQIALALDSPTVTSMDTNTRHELAGKAKIISSELFLRSARALVEEYRKTAPASSPILTLEDLGL